MGFQPGTTAGQATFMDNLKQQGQISHKLFMFVMDSQRQKSQLIIGAPLHVFAQTLQHHNRQLQPNKITRHTSAAKGSFLWLDVLQKEGHVPSMWFIRGMDSFTTGGFSFCTPSDPCVALPDSGTSFLTLPQHHWQAFTASLLADRPDCVVGKDDAILCRSSTLEGLPTLDITLKGHTFSIPPSAYMLSNNQLAVQPFAVKGNFVILGDVFLRVVPTLFDMENLRVGVSLYAPVLTHITARDADPWDTQANMLYGVLLGIAALCVYMLYENLCVHGSSSNSQSTPLPS
jgi:hypothetical protein